MDCISNFNFYVWTANTYYLIFYLIIAWKIDSIDNFLKERILGSTITNRRPCLKSVLLLSSSDFYFFSGLLSILYFIFESWCMAMNNDSTDNCKCMYENYMLCHDLTIFCSIVIWSILPTKHATANKKQQQKRQWSKLDACTSGTTVYTHMIVFPCDYDLQLMKKSKPNTFCQ